MEKLSFVMCDCGTHMVSIEKDSEFDEWYFCMWNYGSVPEKMSWR